jgi:hypothetical protein
MVAVQHIMQLLHAMYLMKYTLVLGLLVADQELGLLVLLISDHWIFFYGDF